METGLRLRALSHYHHHCGGGYGGGLAAMRGGVASSSSVFFSLAASGNGNGAAVGPVGSGVEVERAKRTLHVVLVSPLVARSVCASISVVDWVNCKDMCSIGSRSASCWGKPLGYKVGDTKLKRAGLDYWPYVVIKIHDSWDDFRDYCMKQEGEKRLLAFTKRGKNIQDGLGGGTIRIPMVETYVRCLNLSVSVGIALYEATRQLNYEQLQYQPELPEEAQGRFQQRIFMHQNF
ncbi:uncharacterized protein LOC133899475 [Phragmites australis]|uniref:uncharacterized protein LOC133899475 n=1 Tax=Phragmites australis TaxID=29695 RepID=UPI002D768E4E|nr:uncharacterized protein LOC133899475 [Phragmites australis]